jgi:putative Holliday junction resolvase
MRVLALDLGLARVGVAVSDVSETLAFPRPMIARKGMKDAVVAKRVLELVVEEEAEHAIVGLPVSLRGKHEQAVAEQQPLVELIQSVLATHDIELERVDERMTTKSAARSLSEAGMDSRTARQHIDSAAATVLLQGWLDKRRPIRED